MSAGSGEPGRGTEQAAPDVPAFSRHLRSAETPVPPRLLLIDTCGVEGSLALAEENASWQVAVLERLPGRGASERLLPTLRATLDRLGWTIDELGAVAVVHGPGSFTGVRMGLSAAKGLCEGGGVPLLAISRLAVLADVAGGETGRVHAVLNAGRDEVYYGLYVEGRLEREELLTVQAAMEAIGPHATGGLEGASTVVVCESTLEAEFAGVGARRIEEPTAATALGVAAARLRAGEFADVASLDGNYLRRTEMEIRHRVEAHQRARSGAPDG